MEHKTPNQALQRTPGFGVQLPGAALIRPAQSRAVRPAMKPGTARAFALRRRAHSRVPGPESLGAVLFVMISCLFTSLSDAAVECVKADYYAHSAISVRSTSVSLCDRF